MFKKWWLSLIGVEGEGGKGDGDKGAAKQFTQEDLDRIVGERLARTKSQFSDYDELKKFKEEHAKAEDAAKQAELVKQKKFEEAETTYKKQLAEREQILTQKDQQIQTMRIESALSQEISKQNGFIEETIALVKNNAIITKEGAVMLKLRDTNGIEKEVTVEEGLKQFYTSRPHLVRAKSTSGGSGTPPAGGTGGGAGADDLATLNSQFAAASARGDRKTADEIRKKILTHPNLGNKRAL